MPSPADNPRALQDLLLSGPLPARRVADALGVSRPTLQRLVRAAHGRVVRIGRARATVYALAREIRTFGSTWPVYRVDETGRVILAAHLHALQPRPWWYESVSPPPGWVHGETAIGLFPDLPWFLDDLRPQGFLGGAFARRYGDGLSLGPDPRLWDAGGVLTAFVMHGDDLPGDFVIGEAARERVQRATLNPPPSVPTEERAARYGRLAQAVLAGEVAGSSAGGEQPKFTTCVAEEEGNYRHVLVKFSPPEDTAIGRRWVDLLVCELLAAETLRAHGVRTAAAQLVSASGRTCLEVARFDRIAPYGRHGVVTLAALDNAFYGKLDTWRAAADRLERDGWMTPADAEILRLLWWFGGLIGNTDMHFANVSLELDHARPLRLAPVYDMLPMHYRPGATGEMPATRFVPPLPPPQEQVPWRRAAELAASFWDRAAGDARISDDFRVEATQVRDATRALLDRFG